MPTVAEQLRQAREAQKLDVYQVAEITKIKTDHVRALEEGRFDAFSAPVYIRGFVRTYAKALRLDEAPIMADLETELSRTEKFREPPPLMERPRSPLDALMLHVSRLNWRVAVAIGAVVLCALLTVIVVRNKSRNPDDPLKNLGPGLYQPAPSQSGDTLPVPNPPAKKP